MNRSLAAAALCASALACAVASKEAPPPDSGSADELAKPVAELRRLEAELDALGVGAGERCDRRCLLAGNVCELARRICDIAGRHSLDGDAGRYKVTCEDAGARCARAKQKISDCAATCSAGR
jgi:hypothetical protein